MELQLHINAENQSNHFDLIKVKNNFLRFAKQSFLFSKVGELGNFEAVFLEGVFRLCKVTFDRERKL